MCEMTIRLMELVEGGGRLNVEARGMCAIDIQRIDDELIEERRRAHHSATFYPGSDEALRFAEGVARLEQARAEIVTFLAQPIWD